MDWDAIGSIAELVGAIAVVATLLYFSRQIRSLAADSYASTITQVEEGERELQRLRIDHAALLLKANGGIDLSEEENFVLREIYYSTQGVHFFGFLRSKSYGRDGSNSIRTFAKVLRRYPAFASFYQNGEMRENTGQNAKLFVSLVDKELESSGK